MNYIINPWIFYLISVSDCLNRLLSLVLLLGIPIWVISTMGKYFNSSNSESRKSAGRCAKVSAIVVAISIVLFVFVPSEETCYKILAADMLTQENINAASDYVTNVIDYAVDKVKDLNNGN